LTLLGSEELGIWRRTRQSGKTVRTGHSQEEFRNAFERDRDRILYSASFRRLAVVTQVLSPTEGFAGHNRLTHALKVGQVSRRLAQRLIRKSDADFVDSLGGIDPDVAESAGLAHDLGHPPFGHVAEEELNKVVMAAGVTDGFEGNAQSFRIVTKTEIREPSMPGLDLTRATLGALLKYPWLKGQGPKLKKIGAYKTEDTNFKFARDGLVQNQCTLEAQIMDWADDITYSAHDLEDFYRAGKIPLAKLAKDSAERTECLEAFFQREEIGAADREDWTKLADELASLFPVTEEYVGSRTQKAALRAYVSYRLTRAIETTKLENGKGLVRDAKVDREVELLKHLTMHYVVLTPFLKAQQHSHREVVRGLFNYYLELSNDKTRWSLFPPMHQEQLQEFGDDANHRVRTVADLVAGMGESQAIEAYRSIFNVSWSLY
jgi:dGTPase